MCPYAAGCAYSGQPSWYARPLPLAEAGAPSLGLGTVAVAMKNTLLTTGNPVGPSVTKGEDSKLVYVFRVSRRSPGAATAASRPLP